MGILDRGERDKYNETGLKEGGVIEMSTTVLHSRAALSLEYLPCSCTKQRHHDNKDKRTYAKHGSTPFAV